ncbi:MAG TPA: hypothetical protein VFU53_11945, partial [Burkholderiales bacterium]|nr:hypothetical protein [Burkholderiales bacterium]
MRQPAGSFGQAHALLLLLAFAVPATADELSVRWHEAERAIGIPILLPRDRQLPNGNGCAEFDPLQPADQGAAVAYLKLYTEEFSKYPKSLLRRVGVEWVALVKNLSICGEPRQASYFPTFAFHSMDPRGGLIFDVRQGARSEAYLRWTLHHEFFHFIDAAQPPGEMRAWAALNPTGFRYSGMDAAFSGRLEHPEAGMVTLYAKKSIAEDRAEIAATLFTDE